jgi:hypothetical protein
MSLSKAEDRKPEEILSGGYNTTGKGKDERNVCRRVNIVEILCTYV